VSLSQSYIRIKKKFEFVRQFRSFEEKSPASGKRFHETEKFFIQNEDTSTTAFDRHYIYHTAWASRILKTTHPEKHIDIASSLFFCTIASAFVPIEFYDFRPADVQLTNLKMGKADLLSLPFKDNSIRSLSCMHSIEHVGLGRYGDPLDYDGDLKSITELKRVLETNGNLLVVVPIGRPRIVFNAHRIYGAKQFIEYFKELDLVEFALVPDSGKDGGLVTNPSFDFCDAQNYACGCFWFKKKISDEE
jgi:hypothetical protein